MDGWKEDDPASFCVFFVYFQGRAVSLNKAGYVSVFVALKLNGLLVFILNVALKLNGLLVFILKMASFLQQIWPRYAFFGSPHPLPTVNSEIQNSASLISLTFFVVTKTPNYFEDHLPGSSAKT